MELRTYLGGSLQESSGTIDAGTAQGSDYSQGFSTDEPFDAVEIFIANGDQTAAPTMQIREICASL